MSLTPPTLQEVWGAFALLDFYLFLCSSEKHLFLDKRNSVVHRHAEAEHQNYRVHVKCNGVRAIKYIKDAIVAEIDNERIDGVIACFSKTDKDIIDNCTARIRNIKRNELYYDTEDFARILKSLRTAEKRRPCRNSNPPEHRL